uniref:Uncharacterized protein n=1 Tax=Tetranychus urticae TaxID=32264 RepID=T1K7B0_TETUR
MYKLWTFSATNLASISISMLLQVSHAMNIIHVSQASDEIKNKVLKKVKNFQVKPKSRN